MADDKIQMPMSGGGLVRFSDEVKSKFMLSPAVVMIAIGVITVVLIVLYKIAK